MSTKLIAQDQITASQFSSATEQDGARWGMVIRGMANAGSLFPASSGTPANEIYSSTTTSNGNVGGTTLIDSALAFFGDDYFISATVAITSGTYSGQSRTVSDFSQATGTITVSSAFGGQILSGVTYTITLYYATRDFHLEEIAAGDAGTATFKASHDGGTTWLGRDSPDQASYLGERTVHSGAYANACLLYIPGTMSALCFYGGISNVMYVRKSTNLGWSWGDAVTVGSYTSGQACCLIRLESGRILAVARYVGISCKIYYSDDEGDTWAELVTSGLSVHTASILQLADGTLISGYDEGTTTGGNFGWQRSLDGGETWGAETQIAASNYYNPHFVQLKTGRIICAVTYYTGVYWYLYSYISDNLGANWTQGIIYNSTGGGPFTSQNIIEDINGDVYAETGVLFFRSIDRGSTWAAGKILPTGSRYSPHLCVARGTMLAAMTVLAGSIVVQRRGMLEAYSANAIPMAISLMEQVICSGACLRWYGGAGIVADTWTFQAEFDYSMVNLVADSPSVPWRSETDNAACTILLDAGANSRFYADGAAFFGCNLRSFSYQMNATDSWGSPSVDETISFDLATGTVDSVSGNHVQDTSLLAGYKDHELAGCYIRMTSGTDSGKTWRIADNISGYLILDTTAATNIAAGNTFALYQDHVAKTFTGGLYRYIRLSISAQETAEDYYQIGTMVAGRTVTLTDAWLADPFGYDYELGLVPLEMAHGGRVAIDETGMERRRFSLSWRASIDGRKEILFTLLKMRGKAFCVIPDSGTLTTAHLMTQEGDIKQSHFIGLTRYDLSVALMEVL